MLTKHSSVSRTYLLVSTEFKTYKVQLPEKLAPNTNEQAAAWFAKYLRPSEYVRSCTAIEDLQYILEDARMYEDAIRNAQAEELQISMEEAIKEMRNETFLHAEAIQETGASANSDETFVGDVYLDEEADDQS